MPALGNAISRAMKDAGLNQTDLAEKVGATQQTVSRWTSGRVLPSLDKLPKLAKVLGVDQGELMDALVKDAQTERNTDVRLPSRMAWMEKKIRDLEERIEALESGPAKGRRPAR